MEPKISVIVPIYNSEKYLKKCIDSIVNQTLEDIEIILINDGSKDNSHLICLEYQEKFKEKIKYINNINIGCSATRNLGIKEAKAEYITFVDSDDYIEKDMYKDMYDLITKEESDIVITGIKCIKNKEIVKKKFIKKMNNISDIFDEKNLINYVYAKIFKKSIIEKENIEFIINSHYQEDMVFSFMYCLNVKKVSFLNKLNYNYVLHDMNSVFNLKKRQEVFISYDYLYRYLKKKNVDKRVLRYLYKLFDLYAIGGSYVLMSNSKIVSSEDYKKYKKEFFERTLNSIPLPLKSKIYLIFWYSISSILRTFKLNEFLLKIRRKIRGE
ncbi:glycosyltransferase [Fusobacterium massiliense]|uniref:glycosyltransferase family 2 protein n=1 Tax=Fusobacterium massiliense TaxID=1852365 RepID=UPI0028EDB126|nr:glycosyltransferase [Fusobacterium massiliense]